MDICLSAARAEASRMNGAKSRGLKTADGKARSARNALKHGLRAEKFVLLHDEDAAAFEAMAEALAADLAPVGALQAVLARRLVVAAWRLERAERIECQLFALLRYRGSAMAELWRALRALKALQAQARDEEHGPDAACDAPNEPDAPDPLPAPQADADGEAAAAQAAPQSQGNPIEPKAHGNPGEIAPAPPADEPQCSREICPVPAPHAPCASNPDWAPEATQKCATMRHLCATYAPPSASGR